MKSFQLGSALLAATALGLATASATVLVYEGFNYNLADGASLNGVATNAIGLQGNWSVATTLTSGGSASATFSSTGLSFGPNFFATPGGAVQLSTTPGAAANNFVLAGAQLAASHTGVLWHSHLFQFSAFTTAPDHTSPSAQVRINTAATAGGGSSYLQTHSNASGQFNTPSAAYVQGAVAPNPSLDKLELNTTYLIISRFTNVGNTLNDSTTIGFVNAWVFDIDGYNNWFAAGAQESDLGSFAKWSVNTARTSGTYTFAPDRALQLFNFSNIAGGTQTLLVDEIRYSTNMAAVIPEPSTYAALLGLAVLGFVGWRRFRRR